MQKHGTSSFCFESTVPLRPLRDRHERSFRCLTQINGSIREFSHYGEVSSEAEAQRLDAILCLQDHV